MTSPATQDHRRSIFHDADRKIHIVDLFAGPGGLDVAAHFLGLDTIGIEWDANACETRYSAGLPTIHADVRDMRESPSAALGKVLDDLNDIKVLVGGPPCQTFSVAGGGAGRRALDEVEGFIERLVDEEDTEVIDKELANLGDARTALVLEPLRWIMAAIKAERPYTAIILEQVPTVLPLWRVYKRVLESGRLPGGIKYQAQCKTLRTEEYGVPQSRRRAVLIARIEGHGDVTMPETTHLPFVRSADAAPTLDSALLDDDTQVEKKGKKRAWVSMEKALKKTGEELGRTTPYVVVSNYGSGGDPKNRGRRQSSEPAFTVTGKVSRNAVESPEGMELPRFTIAESGMLQTFPKSFPWAGRDQAQQVGNAVPPRFGVHLIAAALGFDEDRVRSALDSMEHWPKIPVTERERLRRLGCADKIKCPSDPPHPPVAEL